MCRNEKTQVQLRSTRHPPMHAEHEAGRVEPCHPRLRGHGGRRTHRSEPPIDIARTGRVIDPVARSAIATRRVSEPAPHRRQCLLQALDAFTCIADNYATHKFTSRIGPVAQQGCARYHISTTHPPRPRLNQVDSWFGIITQMAIRRGSFSNVRELVNKMDLLRRALQRQMPPPSCGSRNRQNQSSPKSNGFAPISGIATLGIRSLEYTTWPICREALLLWTSRLRHMLTGLSGPCAAFASRRSGDRVL